MKKRLILAALVISGLLLSLTGGLASAQPSANAQGHVPDQILVKFLPGTSDTVKASIHNRHGGKLEGVIPGIDVQVVKIPENKFKDEVKAYKGEASVEFVEPDYIAKAIFTPDDTYFGNQWGMTQIQAPDAWGITQGSSDIKIAILDTGIDQNHEDLAAKIVANKNCTSGRGASRTVDDKYGHGTHVAGIAAAITNNGKGVAGVGFNSTLMNVKVLGDTGSGNYSWVANGIIWAADNGAKVINLSLGGTSPSSTLEDAVNYAWNQGCVIVAAAGNDNTSTPLYPAYYTNCIAVAATDRSDAKASWSNFGTWVDIAAPGVDIFSTTPNHSFYLQNYGYKLNYDYMSGTSMATPHVAGVAALVWATEYGTSNTSVRDRIEGTADQAGTMWSTYGIKRVNAYNAVAPAGPPPPDTTGPVTSGVTASPNPTAGVTSVTLTATISDVTTGGSNIAAAEYFIDSPGIGGSGIPMSASDGSFDSPTEAVTTTVDVSGLSGTHTLYVHGKDSADNWGDTSSTQLNITEAPLPDTTGPVTSSVTASPNPTAGATSVTLTATISDVSTGGSNIASAEYFIDTTGANGSGTPMSASDGAFNSPTEAVTATVDVSGLSGTHTLYVHGQDANVYWGDTSSTQLNVTEAPLPDTTGPVTSSVAASPNPTAGATSVTLTATISDVSTGGSNIAGAEYFIDTTGANGSGTPMSASDGDFDSPTEAITATVGVSGLSTGSHTLYVHGKDSAGNWGDTNSTQLSVTEAPTGNVNDMYVWSIDFRTIGTPLRTSRLYIDITIKHDSNANGIAEATDGAVANATVNIIVTNQTTGQTWTGTGAITGSNGVATYYLNNPPRGSYVVEVIKLTHATYIWNKALDKENPSSPPYTLSRGSGWSTGETLKLLER